MSNANKQNKEHANKTPIGSPLPAAAERNFHDTARSLHCLLLSAKAMAFSSAVGRLSVLSQHLAGAEELQLQRQETRAAGDEDVRPAPGGGPGTLTVLDNRTGKKYTVRVAAWAPAASRYGDNSLARSAAAAAKRRRTIGQLSTTLCYATQLEVSEGGTINAQALKKITAGGDGVGLRTYDPG